MPKRNKHRTKRWQPPPDLFAPSDPEEFKFCFALMNAASSGRMTVERPRPLMIEGIGEVTFNNTPMNRGILAVTKHLRDVYAPPASGETPTETMALCNRIMELGQFIAKRLSENDPLIEKYVRREEEESTGAVEISDALVEAGATAIIGEHGFDADSLFSIAGALAAREASLVGEQ
jgi:hypothetical protein